MTERRRIQLTLTPQQVYRLMMACTIAEEFHRTSIQDDGSELDDEARADAAHYKALADTLRKRLP